MAPLLKILHLHKRFGGVVALNDVSFDVRQGDLLGLIGPTGAGKTTVIDLLTGYHKADFGDVEFEGEEIGRLTPERRVRLGLVRTWQIPKPFPELTASASVAAAVLSGTKRAHRSFADARIEAVSHLEFVGLEAKRDILSRDLTFYERRLLELARVLATGPKLLLIDEMLAGLSAKDGANIIDMIGRALEAFDISALWCELDMTALKRVACRIVLIDRGVKLAEGPPDEVDVFAGQSGRDVKEHA